MERTCLEMSEVVIVSEAFTQKNLQLEEYGCEQNIQPDFILILVRYLAIIVLLIVLNFSLNLVNVFY
ncbi:unnamed protein product [Adineta ricciae]|uniref:Uncharacterized protein n=1 Tax=Adineta ricciae TaxID=249248 RepID=A0A814W835_ADIRI|nr:unnamed protein product [Adineta ricciae]